MNITVTCISCGQKLSAPESFAGRRVPCPKCKAPVDVPVAASIVAPPVIVAPQVVPENRPQPGAPPDVHVPTVAPGNRPHRGWMIAALVGTAIVIIGVSVGWPIWMKKVKAERDFARLVLSENHLQQIGMAFQIYESRAGRFPAAASYGPDGKALLSWRVAILPFLEEKPLYDQFHLDEPWDSPHNAALIAKMPSVYAVPGYEHSSEGKTCYLAPIGEKVAFFGKKGRAHWGFLHDDFTTALFIVESAPDRAVVWTSPVDLDYDEKNPWAGLLGLRDGGFLAAHSDGSCGKIPASTSNEALDKMFTVAGGRLPTAK